MDDQAELPEQHLLRAPAELVAGAHRRIRVLEEKEGPYRGELVACGNSDGLRVRVPAFAVHPKELWALSDEEHVAAPRELVRSADGLDVLFPWCTERVEAFLGRRLLSSVPLRAGEVVTLVGSMVRGLHALGEVTLSGDWWLSDEGCPMIAADDGDTISASTIRIIERVRGSFHDRELDRVLTEISEAANDHRTVQRRAVAWESELTRLAAPQPLERAQSSGEHSFDALIVREGDSARSDATDAYVGERSVRGWSSALRQRVCTALRGVWERRRALVRTREARNAHVTERTRGRRPSWMRIARVSTRPTPAEGTAAAKKTTQPKRRRRSLVLVGVGAAALVVAVGVLWPVDDGPAEADQSDTVPHAQADAERSELRPALPSSNEEPGDEQRDEKDSDAHMPDRGASAQGQTDPAEAARTLLGRLANCAKEKDEHCETAIEPGSDARVRGAVQEPSEKDATTLVEDFGDIAVVRRTPVEGDDQMMVLVRREEKWLVRDAYDIADQPEKE